MLVVSVELPTLTFQRSDLSQANLISCVLFGDGAAAAIVTGQSGPGPQIVQSETHTFPDSLDAMGFDLRDSGFHVVLSKTIPDMIRGHIAQLVNRFLARSHLTRESIAGFILHPGGQKVLSHVEHELGLSRTDTQISWDVLRDYGNLSSATILFILDAWIRSNRLKPGEYGLAATFGPGFSAELLLLRWC